MFSDVSLVSHSVSVSPVSAVPVVPLVYKCIHVHVHCTQLHLNLFRIILNRFLWALVTFLMSI